LRDLGVLTPPLLTTPKLRITPIVENNYDLSIGEGEGEGERLSGEVGCIEAYDWGPSKQLAMSLSKSALGLKGKERGGIIGYSASSSPPTSISRSASNRKVSDSEESEQALVKSRSSSSISKMQSAGMLERGGGLQGEAGVCVTREWKDLGDVGKGEERWFTSLEEEEAVDEVFSTLLPGNVGEGRRKQGSGRWCKRE